MGILAIAMIADKDNGDVLGFRLLDTETGEVRDIELEQIQIALEMGSLHIDNLAYERDIIVGANGRIARMPRIENGVLANEPSMTIINEIEGFGYTAADYNGQVVKMPARGAVAYAEKFGIANGKVVTKGNGTKYISAINGSYPVVQLIQTTPERHNSAVAVQTGTKKKNKTLTKLEALSGAGDSKIKKAYTRVTNIIKQFF